MVGKSDKQARYALNYMGLRGKLIVLCLLWVSANDQIIPQKGFAFDVMHTSISH